MHKSLALIAAPIAALVLCAPALAAPSSPTNMLYGAPGQPNLSGVWDAYMMGTPPGIAAPATPSNRDRPQPYWGATPPPLTPAYAAIHQKFIDAANAGNPLADTVSECKALGVPYLEMGPGTMEVIQTPGRITMIQEAGHEVRRIYTDGRKLDPDADPWFDGHNIGHFEGLTLVVQTTNIRPETPLDSTDTPHSDALQVIERWTLVKPDILRVEAVATDPKAFTHPWTATHYFTRSPPQFEAEEYVCEDNNRNPTNPDGTQGLSTK